MDYLAPMKRAIDYIEEHLDEELFSEDIAKAAGYSVYHLTHIFTAVIGEPVSSYIKKRRLSESRQKLLYSDKRILDIAVETGFGSSEAYSRAFRSTYGISPAAYRKNNLDLYTGSKKPADPETLQHLRSSVTITPRIVESAPVYVAGICQETSTLYNILPDLWDQLLALSRSMTIPPDARGIGLCETTRSETLISRNGEIIFSELVGIEVDCFDNLPAGLSAKTIPGGRHAVFTHKGPVRTLMKTYDYIWGSWSLCTKETLDDREDYEVYDARFLGADHPDSQIDIYIPIK